MAEEKTVVFNLRKELLKCPRTSRSKDAILILKRRAARFSSNGEVKVGQDVSEKIWSRGLEHTPTRLRLKVKRQDDGSVSLEMAA